MAAFSVGDVVKVPFPYTDRQTRQWRPALVVAAGALTTGHGLIWVLMITSAENRPWPGDVPFDFAAAGLPSPSVVRTAKIATLDAADAEPVGCLAAAELADVRRLLTERLAG